MIEAPRQAIRLTKDLYYETLRIRNLQEIDKFCSKLGSLGLDKSRSLNKQTHWITTESVH